jgi:hypothetical protein
MPPSNIEIRTPSWTRRSDMQFPHAYYRRQAFPMSFDSNVMMFL